MRIKMAQSPVRSILRYFPYSLHPLAGYFWRVKKLYGSQLERAPFDLRHDVANAIQRAKSRYAQLAKEHEQQLEQLARSLGLPSAQPTIHPDRVYIYKPESGTLELWPPSFICLRCKTYYLMPDAAALDACHTCDYKKFEQPGLIHVCYSCSNYQPILPPPWLARYNRRDGDFICRKCNRGRIALRIKRGKLSKTRWKCNGCGAEAQTQIPCDKCSPSKGSPALMALKPVSESPMRPAVISRVFAGYRQISEAIKEGGFSAGATAEEALIRNGSRPDLIEGVFGINAKQTMLLNDITAILCTYGYYSTRDARVRFFEERQPGRAAYKAYAAVSRGSAILISFDDTPPAGPEKRAFLHTAEHALSKACHLLAGVEEGAFMGKVFEEHKAVIIYEAMGSESGGLSYVFNYRLEELFTEALRIVMSCKYDCDRACMGCIFIKDWFCHPFDEEYIRPNSHLDRKLVLNRWTSRK